METCRKSNMRTFTTYSDILWYSVASVACYALKNKGSLSPFMLHEPFTPNFTLHKTFFKWKKGFYAFQ